MKSSNMAGSFQSIGYAVAQSPLINKRSFVANNPKCHHGKVGTSYFKRFIIVNELKTYLYKVNLPLQRKLRVDD